MEFAQIMNKIHSDVWSKRTFSIGCDFKTCHLEIDNLKIILGKKIIILPILLVCAIKHFLITYTLRRLLFRTYLIGMLLLSCLSCQVWDLDFLSSYETNHDPDIDNIKDPTLKVVLKYRYHSRIIAINNKYEGESFSFSFLQLLKVKLLRNFQN